MAFCFSTDSVIIHKIFLLKNVRVCVFFKNNYLYQPNITSITYCERCLATVFFQYNNIQDARIWIIVNNIYILSTVTCFLFVWFKVGSIVICIKTMIILSKTNTNFISITIISLLSLT